MAVLGYKDFLEKLLRKAGTEIINRRKLHDKAKEKEKNEIVTPADILSNKIITSSLKKQYPDIPVYSEEEKVDKSMEETRWILDPLDGTTPWVWGNSGFAISLALEKEEKIILGAVYDPVFEEFFYAEEGKGAFRNGLKLKVSGENNVKKMFLVVDWGYKSEKRIEGLKYFQEFLLPEMFASRIVPQWAPALGLARIAEGRIHGLICNDTWAEDHSAGALIIKEAGGFVTNFYHTKSFDHREFGIIAANSSKTHDLIVCFLQQKRII